MELCPFILVESLARVPKALLAVLEYFLLDCEITIELKGI